MSRYSEPADELREALDEIEEEYGEIAAKKAAQGVFVDRWGDEYKMVRR